MKTIVITIFIFLISIFLSSAQTKIYQEGGAIRIENSIDTFSINSVQFDWRKSGAYYYVRDNIQKNEINIGKLSQVYDETESLATEAEIKTYLNSLTNSINNNNIDTTTNALMYIDYENHKINSGSHFFINEYSGTLAANDEISICITTPNTSEYSYFTFVVGSTEGAKIDIYEDCTTVSGGATLTAYNSNRNSSNVSNLTIVIAPTYVVGGQKICGYLAGAENEIGETSREREIVLKKNSIYFWRLTSLANSNIISLRIKWYEHTSK